MKLKEVIIFLSLVLSNHFIQSVFNDSVKQKLKIKVIKKL